MFSFRAQRRWKCAVAYVFSVYLNITGSHSEVGRGGRGWSHSQAWASKHTARLAPGPPPCRLSPEGKSLNVSEPVSSSEWMQCLPGKVFVRIKWGWCVENTCKRGCRHIVSLFLFPWINSEIHASVFKTRTRLGSRQGIKGPPDRWWVSGHGGMPAEADDPVAGGLGRDSGSRWWSGLLATQSAPHRPVPAASLGT